MDALTSGRTGKTALVAALLLGFYGLMSFQANRAGTVSALQGAVLWVASPIQRVAGGAWSAAAGAWDRYVGLAGAAAEAERLRRRVAELERRHQELNEAALENGRLRRLLELRRRPGLSGQGAEVVGRDLSHGYETLTVDRGSRDGIIPDTPVLSPDGDLVGRVVRTAAWTSMVELITAPRSAVGARIGRSRAPGILHGQGRSSLRLDYVETGADVVSGDLVETSGTDGIYPPGIRVGRIVDVAMGPATPGASTIPLQREEGALFLEIVVEPRTDVLHVEELLLLTAGSEQ